jgi:hypothetical protein
MSATNSPLPTPPTAQPGATPTFEETAFEKAAQLLADPLSESTRKRQSLLLLLSALSLAIFVGIVEAPEKLSLGAAEAKTDTMKTSQGVPSRSPSALAYNALRFNEVLCPVIIYLLVAFGISAYRDYKAANYLSKGPLSQLQRSQDQLGVASRQKTDAVLNTLEELNKQMEERDKEWTRVTALMDHIEKQFAARREPLLEASKKAQADFESVRLENSERTDKAKQALTEANGELYDLSQERSAQVKPYLDQRDKLLNDPQLSALRAFLEEQTKELQSIRLAEKTALVRQVFRVHERWKKLWFWFEVLLPGLFAALAIIIPASEFF